MTSTPPVVVLQARMGSSRLPGKVLMELAGQPMLMLMLDRLRRLDLPVVVATSTLERDDPVAEAAEAAGYAVARGSEHDVLERFIEAVSHTESDHVVRLTADCPLIDPALVLAAVELAMATGADYVSNSLVRTYPDGLDVEVLTRAALEDAAVEADLPDEREHVTPFVYRRPNRFTLAALADERCLGSERWTVDTAEDLARLRSIVADLDDPVSASWLDVLDAAGCASDVSVLRPDLAGRSGPATTPAARTWEVLDEEGLAEGWVGVQLTGPGNAIARGSIEPDRRGRAVDALRVALLDDLQVADLTVPDDWSCP